MIVVDVSMYSRINEIAICLRLTFVGARNGSVTFLSIVHCGHTGWPKKVSHFQIIKKSY